MYLSFPSAVRVREPNLAPSITRRITRAEEFGMLKDSAIFLMTGSVFGTVDDPHIRNAGLLEAVPPFAGEGRYLFQGLRLCGLDLGDRADGAEALLVEVQEDAVHGHVFHEIVERALQGGFQIEAAAYEHCHLTKEFVFIYGHGLVPLLKKSPVAPFVKGGEIRRTRNSGFPRIKYGAALSSPE